MEYPRSHEYKHILYLQMSLVLTAAYMVSVQVGLHGATVTHEEIRVNEKYCTRSFFALRW